MASFVAAQRTEHGVPHAVACRALELASRGSTSGVTGRRRGASSAGTVLDAAVKRSFEESERDYGSPRVREDLRERGWKVSKKTVAASMARQGLVGRPTRRRRRCLTRPDKAAPPVTGPGQTGLHRRRRSTRSGAAT